MLLCVHGSIWRQNAQTETQRGVRLREIHGPMQSCPRSWCLTQHVISPMFFYFFSGLPSIQPLYRHSGWVSLESMKCLPVCDCASACQCRFAHVTVECVMNWSWFTLRNSSNLHNKNPIVRKSLSKYFTLFAVIRGVGRRRVFKHKPCLSSATQTQQESVALLLYKAFLTSRRVTIWRAAITASRKVETNTDVNLWVLMFWPWDSFKPSKWS